MCAPPVAIITIDFPFIGFVNVGLQAASKVLLYWIFASKSIALLPVSKVALPANSGFKSVIPTVNKYACKSDI